MSRTLTYQVKGKSKTTTYFLAQLLVDVDPVLSEEHTEFKFVSRNDMKAIANFPDFLAMVEAFDSEIREIHQLL